MKNKSKLGFGIIEVIIAMAIVAIIGKVAYSSYQESLIRANEENAKHKLVNLMQEMEKYYATHGAYSATSGAWPAAVSQKIASLNANSKEPYTYTVFPLEPAGNNQATCINASPKSNTIQDNNSQLLIDEQNNIAVNSVIPTKCLAVLTPPVVNPVINACFNADGTRLPYSPFDKNCKADGPNIGKDNCPGYTLSACTGNCDGAKACGPSTLGCKDNCKGAFVYNGPCQGACDGATIYLLSGSTIDFACKDNCKDVKIIVPQSWATRPTTCNNGNSSGACICKGACNGVSVTFY